MRYLIDTNVFLFYTLDREQLDSRVLDILEDYGNEIFISSESLKEIVLLLELKKIRFSQWRRLEDVLTTLEEWCFRVKFVTMEHACVFARLSPVANHRDPVDRMIIAQAIAERLTLISSDRMFDHYRRQGLDFIYNKR